MLRQNFKLCSNQGLCGIFVLVATSAWAAFGQPVSETKQLVKKEVASSDGKYHLRLTMSHPEKQKFVSDGKESWQTGTRFRLHKWQTSNEPKFKKEEALVWTLFRSEFSPRKPLWTGDVWLDAANSKVYIAIADVSSVSVYSSLFDKKLKEPDGTLPVTLRFSVDKTKVKDFDSAWFPHYLTPSKFVPIRELHIESKIKDSLILVFGSLEKPQQKWSISLTDNKWEQLEVEQKQ